jgi:hypothetical protein
VPRGSLVILMLALTFPEKHSVILCLLTVVFFWLGERARIAIVISEGVLLVAD